MTSAGSLATGSASAPSQPPPSGSARAAFLDAVVEAAEDPLPRRVTAASFRDKANQVVQARIVGRDLIHAGSDDIRIVCFGLVVVGNQVDVQPQTDPNAAGMRIDDNLLEERHSLAEGLFIAEVLIMQGAICTEVVIIE